MRGQSVPLDLLAGLAVSLLMLAYFIALWGSFADRYYELFRKDSRDVELLSISDALVSSPGIPENWTSAPQQAQLIGLARSPRILDQDRIDALSGMAYADSKHLLGLDRDFLIVVEGLDGTRYATIGLDAANSSSVSEVSRLAMLNGAEVRVKVRIYEE